MGNVRDREIAKSRAYHQYQQQQSLARAVSSQDAVAMTHNGLSDSVIINHIGANGVRQQQQVADVIALHQQGISEPVISAMQQGRRGTNVAAAPVRVYQPAPQPVVVEHDVAPRYHHYPVRRRFRPRHHFGHAHGPSFHFALGH